MDWLGKFKAKYFQTISFRAPLPRPDPTEIQGGIDFSQGERRPDGRLCVIKETEVDQVVKDPILECTHRNIDLKANESTQTAQRQFHTSAANLILR